MYTKSLLALGIIFFVSHSDTTHAQTQNLLPNGDFSDVNKIIGWTTQGPGSIAYSYTADADGSTGSGSLSMSAGDNANAQIAISGCFPVTPGAPFSFGGKYASGDSSLVFITSDANLSCAVFASNDCTGGTNNWFTSPHVQFGSGESGFKSFQEVSGTIDGFARSASCAVALNTTYVDFDTAGPSGIYIDDLYFNSIPPAAPGIKLGGYMSGNWYDPAESGHGFLLEFTAQANTVIAAWFVYAPDGSGQQRWIYSQGTYDTSTNVVTLPAELTSGASFPPLFNKTDVERTLWGNITFSFSDCNHGTAIWNSTVPGYGSGSIPIVRMTQVAGTSCPI